jgi:hypothetical protein
MPSVSMRVESSRPVAGHLTIKEVMRGFPVRVTPPAMRVTSGLYAIPKMPASNYQRPQPLNAVTASLGICQSNKEPIGDRRGCCLSSEYCSHTASRNSMRLSGLSFQEIEETSDGLESNRR